jgi:hypothetical protein
MALCYGMDGRGLNLGKGFLFPTASRPALEPSQPPIQTTPRALSLGARETVSPPSISEVKEGAAIQVFPHMSPWHSA